MPFGIAELNARVSALLRVLRRDAGREVAARVEDRWWPVVAGQGADPDSRYFLKASEALLESCRAGEAWRALTNASHLHLYRQGRFSDDIQRRALDIAKAAGREDPVTAIETLLPA